MKNLVILFFLVAVVSCSKRYNPEITIEDLKENIEYLASDSLKGRKSGDSGDLLAAEFIRSKFEVAGLELLFDNGFQKFTLVTSAEVDAGNSFEVNGNFYDVEKDYLPRTSGGPGHGKSRKSFC